MAVCCMAVLHSTQVGMADALVHKKLHTSTGQLILCGQLVCFQMMQRMLQHLPDAMHVQEDQVVSVATQHCGLAQPPPGD